MLMWCDKKVLMPMDYTLENCSTYQTITIANKKIYIFDSHNMALPVWGTVASRIGQKLNLVTFDHHTDTHAPFTVAVCREEGAYSKESSVIKDILSSKHYELDDFCFEDVWKIAAGTVHCDEQILTAYLMDYLNSYHVVSNLTAQEADAYKRQDEVEGHTAHYYSRDCIPCNMDALIDYPAVLDIDLDYIENRECIKADEKAVLTRLFSKAEVITIAREPKWFERCKKDPDFTNSQALEMLLEIFRECEEGTEEGAYL